MRAGRSGFHPLSFANMLADFESAAYAEGCDILTALKLKCARSATEFFVWTGARIRA